VWCGVRMAAAEELLQAVVLADSFDTKFYPITLHMPRVCRGAEGTLHIS